jgi:hypothetical protein
METAQIDATANMALWEDITHKAIVKKAIEMMAAYVSNGGGNPHTKDFLVHFGQADFSQALYQGLKDADYKSPWCDTIFEAHFYNPHNSKNFRGNQHWTAYSQTIKYFKLSQHYAQRINYFVKEQVRPGAQLYKNAGYYLGLSLHFFTDLTQPMHAANFANVFGFENGYPQNLVPDLRHESFEIYVDNAINRGLLNDLVPLVDAHLGPFPNHFIGDWIDVVAKRSWATFDGKMRDTLRNKEKRKVAGWTVGKLLPEAAWRDEEAKPIMEESTKVAPYDVVNFLTNWALQGKQVPSFGPGKWYEIETLAQNGNRKILCATRVPLNHWLMRSTPAEATNQLFHIMFNADGTALIGCKDYIYNTWFLDDWVGFSNHKPHEIERGNCFRIVSYNHTDSDMMIFESTQNNAVTLVVQGDGEDYYRRLDTAYNSRQWFKLIEKGTMSQGEKDTLRSTFPGFENYNWAGDPNTVPAWEANIPADTGGNALCEEGDGPDNAPRPY